MRFFPSPSGVIGLTALALVAASPLMAGPPAGWQLVFSDEFEGHRLDVKKWGTEMAFAGTHGPRYHNEYYVSYTVDEDVILEDGILRLRTDRRTVEGHEAPGRFDYTQGLVSSHDRFAFTHGYLEIRARFPSGKGLWPCIWLMPEHQSWPPEFDIAEYYGGQRKMHHGLAYGTMHDPQWDSTGDTETKFENKWRTFGFEWTRGRAVWSVDGRVQKTIVADYVPNCAMYILLSNSVSSIRGPSSAPDAATVFPNFLEIDYVRVYQPAPFAPPPTILVKGDMPTADGAAEESAQ
jgi:beta-glucanase (GH16 family)